jgi:glycerol-3-phosphate acyltransferase PlsY
MPASPVMLSPIVSLAIAYLVGSIPSAYLAGRSRGIDLRQHGSGNLGATNVVRVLGGKIGALVFVVDIVKGFLPVYFLPRYTVTEHTQLLALALGLAAIIGHVRPIFLLWRGGGKGVATAAGVFLGLVCIPTLIAFLAWIVVFLLWWYVSLASLVAAAVLPLALLVTGVPMRSPVFIAAVLVMMFVFYTHRANIERLRRGEEHNFRRSRSRS